MSTWIKIHRKIREHWLWSDSEKLKWWLDILITVNTETNKSLIKGKLIECHRGQSIKSLDTWARDWRTTKKTVSIFFKCLEGDGMVKRENLKITTRLTVCNYEDYQSAGNAKETHGKRTINGEYTQATLNIRSKEEKKKEEFVFENFVEPILNPNRPPHAPLYVDVFKFFTDYGHPELALKFFEYHEGNAWLNRQGQPIAYYPSLISGWISNNQSRAAKAEARKAEKAPKETKTERTASSGASIHEKLLEQQQRQRDKAEKLQREQDEKLKPA